MVASISGCPLHHVPTLVSPHQSPPDFLFIGGVSRWRPIEGFCVAADILSTKDHPKTNGILAGAGTEHVPSKSGPVDGTCRVCYIASHYPRHRCRPFVGDRLSWSRILLVSNTTLRGLTYIEHSCLSPQLAPQEVVIHPEDPTPTAVEVSRSVASHGPKVIDTAVVEERHGVAAAIFMELNYVPSPCPIPMHEVLAFASLPLIPWLGDNKTLPSTGV